MMTNNTINSSASYLREDFERMQTLFQAQPTITQRFFEAQAGQLANGLINDNHHLHFQLPNQVVCKTPFAGDMATVLIPDQHREQSTGGRLPILGQRPTRELLKQKLNELEQSPDQAISTCAALMRHAIATYMIHQMLPEGRAVNYQALEGEQIPTIPIKNEDDASPAITSEKDAISEQDGLADGQGRLLVPYVSAAQRFFLPQWVAFDDKDTLLIGSTGEAEAFLASMTRYVEILHGASSLAPYMVASEEYQRKRYGILGQIINQGRALARHKTRQIIQSIQQRVEKGTLNRGLSISLSFYDDQELKLSTIEMEIIPAGRIIFNPVFVVRATRLESAKVSQDTRLDPSTRKHILDELAMLEQAFGNKLIQKAR
jgi:hypothetical protein